ncbi:MAG: DUF2207 domain-containing protein [bacterium]|nr:DUF2207 domain-containing protein [bacterium]
MLKRLFALITLSLLLLAPTVSAQGVDNFRISSFEADYYLSRDSAKTSMLRVEERIVAEFPNFDQNRGIERAIPKKYQGHTVSLQIESVINDVGQAINYTTRTENDNEILRIGDADKFVRGRQVYNIKYSLKNVINFQDSDEFYWDINGTEWRVTSDSVVARLHLPAELATSKIEEEQCFTGFSGASAQDCRITTEPSEDGLLTTVSVLTPLAAGENLTMVIGFTDGTFELGSEIQAEKNRVKLLIIAAIAAFLAPILGVAGFMINRWRKYGRDPSRKTAIVPEYIPPQGFTALKGEMILQEKIRPVAVTATILELAVAHYIVIHEIKKKSILKDSTEFELEIVKDVSTLAPEQQAVLNEIFSSNTAVGQRVNMNTLKNKLHKTVQDLDKSLGDTLSQQGYFRHAPHQVKKNYLKAGGIMMAIGSIGFFIPFFIPVTLGLLIAGGIVMAFGNAMPARTHQGVEMRTYLDGLKEYMKLAEQERLEFSQGLNTAERFKASPTDPAEKIKLFERLLPYSVLFGLDKDWAKEFADLYAQPPSWYSGNVGTFNAAYLGASLGSFNSATASAFSAPSSSGSSGFGGGGFSGGGGGGGGGGGW